MGNSSFLMAREASGDVLVFEGTVLKVRPLAPPAVADAIESISNFKNLNSLSVFRSRKSSKAL